MKAILLSLVILIAPTIASAQIYFAVPRDHSERWDGPYEQYHHGWHHHDRNGYGGRWGYEPRHHRHYHDRDNDED